MTQITQAEKLKKIEKVIMAGVLYSFNEPYYIRIGDVLDWIDKNIEEGKYDESIGFPRDYIISNILEKWKNKRGAIDNEPEVVEYLYPLVMEVGEK